MEFEAESQIRIREFWEKFYKVTDGTGSPTVQCSMYIYADFVVFALCQC